MSLGGVSIMPIPQSRPSWWTDAAENINLWHTSKSDLDNIVKNLTDCMETMRFFKNDSQICEIRASKLYAVKPMWRVRLSEIPNPTSKKEYLEMMDKYQPKGGK